MIKFIFIFIFLLIVTPFFGQQYDEVEKKTSPFRAPGDQFSSSVSVKGDIAVAGNHKQNLDVNGTNSIYNCGIAIIYEKQNGVWSSGQTVDGGGSRVGSRYFGNSTAISDNQVFVGSMNDGLDSLDNNSMNRSGAVFVYEKTGGVWTQVQKITPFDRNEFVQFGYSLDVEGDQMVVGCRGNGSSVVNSVLFGVSYIYEKNASGYWIFKQKILNPGVSNFSENFEFGWSVAISDDWLAISDAVRPYDRTIPVNTTDNRPLGGVYVYENQGGVWVFKDTLFSPFVLVNTSNPEGTFGGSLDISDGKLVISDAFSDGEKGRVFIYELTTSINHIQTIDRPLFGHSIANLQGGWFGFHLDLDHDKLLVGAPKLAYIVFPIQNSTLGAAALYRFDGASFNTASYEVIQQDSPGGEFNGFGAFVSVDSNKIFVSAIGDVTNEFDVGVAIDTAGAIFIFEQCIEADIPQISSVTNSLTICSGDSVQLVIDPLNSLNSTRDWFWYTGAYGAGTLVDSTDTVWVKPTLSTTYSVAGEGYCVGAETSGNVGTVTITVIANPSVSVVASPNDTICTGESVILNGSGASSYVWDNGVSNGVSFIPTSTQTYKVVGTSNGCKDSATIEVVLLTNPSVAITPLTTNTICSGTAIVLSGTGASSYTWDNSVSNATSFTPTVTTTYTVIGSGSNNCTDTESITVTVVAGPTVSISAGITTVCEGAPVSISASGADVYTWDNGIGPGSSAVVTPSTTTDYTVTGTQSATNCTDSEVITITVNSLPNVVAVSTPNDTLCLGENLTLTGSGASTYSWNNGVIDGIIFTPSLGQVQYVLTGTDLNSCVNRDTVNVRVTQPPNIGALGPLGALCSGSPATLTGTGAISYVWDNGVMDGVSFTPSNTQIYNVIGTDANNCTGTASIQVVVNQSPNVSGFSSAGGASLCEGDTLTLTATGNGQSYSWDNNVQDASPFIPGVGSNVYIVTATSSNSCTSQASVTVVVNEQEDATITLLPSLCGDVAIQTLEGVSPNGVWQGIGIVNSTTGEFDASVAGEGTHEIIYTTTGICNDADTINVEVFQELIVNAYGDSVCFGDIDGNIRVEVVQGVAPYNYLWETEETSPNLLNLGEGVYQVIVTDANNCIKNVDVTVFMTENCNYHIFLPNIFSPNGDGINDELFVRGKGFESLEFFIFDRWGNKVFESTDKEKGWNGTNAGKKVASGVYVYYVSVKYFDGSVITKEGNVSVSY